MTKSSEACHPHLTAAMQTWLQAGHKQVEFTNITKLHPAIASRLATGDRPCSDAAFSQIFSSFLVVDRPQAIRFLLAWVQDHLPDTAADILDITPRDTSAIPPRPEDHLERALQWLLNNYRTNPIVAEWLLSGYELAHSKFILGRLEEITPDRPETPKPISYLENPPISATLRVAEGVPASVANEDPDLAAALRYRENLPPSPESPPTAPAAPPHTPA